MAQTSRITLRRLSRFWDKAKEWILEQIAQAIQPAGEKEIISVLTYASEAPSETGLDEGTYYINSTENQLYGIHGGQWAEAIAQTDVIYITADTSHLYVWNGSAFVDMTGEPVDGIIYMNSFNDEEFDNYTEKGIYNVAVKAGPSGGYVYFSMTVSVSTRTYIIREQGHTIRERHTYYTQTLHNNVGYYKREREDVGSTEGTWSNWEIFTYVSTDELKKVEKLAKAGCVL